MQKAEFFDLLKTANFLDLVHLIKDEPSISSKICKMPECITSDLEYYPEDVDVRRVIGTNHQSYIDNSSWSYYLEHMSRFKRNHSKLRMTPEYYYGTVECRLSYTKNDMAFATFDNGLSYYICNDGNHRTFLAKHIFLLEQYFTGHSDFILREVKVFRFPVKPFPLISNSCFLNLQKSLRLLFSRRFLSFII